MTATIEVFADISCPFTHVGLKVIAAEIQAANMPVQLQIRAWPLEWVNGSPLEAAGVAEKVAALSLQLDIGGAFDGFHPDDWPNTTIPALNLVDAAYQRDAATGFAVSVRLRNVLFEEGGNVADNHVLADVADEFALSKPGPDPAAGVLGDYAEGQRRGVSGSPDFWVDGHEFFCPSLDIGHGADGSLTVSFDDDGLRQLVRNLQTPPPG